jgi:exodeoxyribonuclease V alpha subunit
MKKTPLGVNAINEALQKALNTSKEKIETRQGTFFVGDKVMQIRNNAEKNVFNGDIGFIKKIDNEFREVVVSYPDNDAESANLFFDVIYDFRELDEITLAYACTIHKSQGSEYPAVIMVVSYQHYIMLQRNLIYTGITRAKRLCFILGTNKAIYHASNNVPVQKRNTTLVKRVYEFINSFSDENEEFEDFSNNEGPYEEQFSFID